MLGTSVRKQKGMENAITLLGGAECNYTVREGSVQPLCNGFGDAITLWDYSVKVMPHVTISSTTSSTFHRRRWLLPLQR